MRAFVLRRIFVSILVLLTISTLSFMLLKASGDLSVTLAGEGGGADYAAFLRKMYGWDRPLPVQYFDWLWRLLKGDLGTSFYYNSPVVGLIVNGMKVTFTLGAISIGIALVVGVLLGVGAGVWIGSWFDRGVLVVIAVAQAVPIFWVCFLLMLLFGLKLAWLPIAGDDGWVNFIMPSFALAFYAMPAIARIVRTGMDEALASDYVKTARAKGLREFQVVFGHALRNTLVPLVAVASVQFGFLLSGSVVVETIFAMHGIGYLTWDAISQNDYPVVQASVMAVSMFYVVLTLLSDFLNMWIDPRIRYD
jgi:ABC-type dipeptide/oligopeptide/nickel transport system permease component